MKHRVHPDAEPSAVPMPLFPDLQVFLQDDPFETAQRWSRQMQEFKVAWDEWCLTQQGH